MAGVYCEGSFSAINCTFENNTTAKGYKALALALEYTGGTGFTRNVINCTFYNNTSTENSSGYALYVDRQGANIMNSTFINNSNGVFTYSMSANELYITNSILANSTGNDLYMNSGSLNGIICTNSVVEVVSDASNFISYTACLTGDQALLNVTTPTTNGGNDNLTPYIALTTSSIAVDVGVTGNYGHSNSGGSIAVPSNDQRGYYRTGGATDIGSYEYDGFLPTIVTGVTSTKTDGNYTVGEMIPVSVTFSGNVIVTGIPQITLETGSTDAIVNYTSGSGTNTLTFNYTVGAGDISSDLDYVATTALALNGGTIIDASSDSAILTLASPGATNSLGANKAIVIDNTAPTISSVTANWGDYLTEVEDNTNSTVTVVTGGAEDGQIVTLTLNSANYTGAVASNSTSITVTAADLQALSNNTTYTLTTNVSDVAGNAATAYTATTFKALNNPSANNALEFDGTNDYVTIPDNDELDITGDITLEAWVKFDDLIGSQVILEKSDGGASADFSYGLRMFSSKIRFQLGNSSTSVVLAAPDAPPIGEWFHIAGVNSSGSMTLYINGVSVATGTITGNIDTNNDPLIIGKYDGHSQYFGGQMDEVRIWNDARTPSEISANMSSELNGGESGLVAYYKFNEPNTNIVASNFASATGASYDGTLTNMVGTEWTTSTAFASDNTAPSFTSTPVLAIKDNEAYSYTITTTDTENDAVTVTATTLPSWLSL